MVKKELGIPIKTEVKEEDQETGEFKVKPEVTPFLYQTNEHERVRHTNNG